ncbi:hypothetical protein EYB53_021465 [Candidatus Chloroploca sp. M-50]|uniref:Glycine zipper family protein n=1 Tax=Candidatus Chloroploca mongolica TaxID=2528176 RepID=A0ABS4DFS5_9CHLR|nr:hypothetical protein [Candidatus Chloroploca mongolica]MBP1468294.1 hypothetical protein [Candidatus Chloroploca mongolica]
MSQDNDHTGAVGAGDESAAARLRNTNFGVGISIGAGLGIVAGLLFGDMLSGMVCGAGIGIVVDAVRNLRSSVG